MWVGVSLAGGAAADPARCGSRIHEGPRGSCPVGWGAGARAGLRAPSAFVPPRIPGRSRGGGRGGGEGVMQGRGRSP